MRASALRVIGVPSERRFDGRGPAGSRSRSVTPVVQVPPPVVPGMGDVARCFWSMTEAALPRASPGGVDLERPGEPFAAGGVKFPLVALFLHQSRLRVPGSITYVPSRTGRRRSRLKPRRGTSSFGNRYVGGVDETAVARSLVFAYAHASRQTTKRSARCSPRAKRSTAKPLRSNVGCSPRTSCARCSPIAGRLLEAVAREARRVQEAPGRRRLAHDRVVVGADLVVAPPAALDRQLEDQREALERVLGDVLELGLASAEDDARPLARGSRSSS